MLAYEFVGPVLIGLYKGLVRKYFPETTTPHSITTPNHHTQSPHSIIDRSQQLLSTRTHIHYFIDHTSLLSSYTMCIYQNYDCTRCGHDTWYWLCDKEYKCGGHIGMEYKGFQEGCERAHCKRKAKGPKCESQVE